ncbi:MAG: cobalt ECF transporter T component CbiQ [Euryarchaeota archaeon]|nr:cobalt ECF transporter T component CbiQ [Euryarchaeota archaeon]
MGFEHDEVDRFAKGSRFFRFDPRVKLACTIFFICVVAMLRDLTALYLALVFTMVLVEASGVPMRHMVSNFILAFPFILFAFITMFLTSSLENAVAICFRISASVLALLLMVSTTPFFSTLKALRWYKVPEIVCNLLLFTYRFIFLLIDEMSRMRLARKARGFTGGRNLLDLGAFKTISYTIGMVLVRSNVRATKIYDALLSRGYTGDMRTIDELRVRARDAGFAFLFIGFSCLLISMQLEAVHWT